MKPDTVFKLEEIHYLKKSTVAWFVAGLFKGRKKERAHFTVHKGNRPISDFIPAIVDEVRDYRAEKEVEERMK